MYFLCSIIIIDCIVTYFTVGLNGQKELNPLMAWMIPHIGVLGMLFVKILYSSIILYTVEKIKRYYSLSIEKWYYYVGILYIIVWTIGAFGGVL